jgi:MATE family multidrug resistance protein
MTAIAQTANPRSSSYLSEARATLALAWPMVLTNLGQTAMTATDVMLMGRLGPEALAAGTLGSNIYFALMMFGFGLVSAVAPMAAAALGNRRHSVREVRRTVRQGLWASLFVSIPIWLMLWNTEQILLAMGQDPQLSAQAGIYMRAQQWAVLPFYGYIVLRSFLAALERPRWASIVVLVTVAFNALAAWSLMFGHFGLPRLGIMGAGIATTLASTAMFIGLAVVVSRDRKFRRFHLFGRIWRSDWPRFRALMRLGLPISIIVSLEVTIFSTAALLMGLIDAISLAAHAIALQIASICFMVPLGIGQAVTVRVGRAFGAGDHAAMVRSGWTAFVMGVGFMVLTALTMISIPHLLIGAFMDVGDPQNAAVVATATTFLVFAAMFQIFDGAQAVGAGMLRGLQDTVWPMIYAAIGYWGVGMPLGIVLAFHTPLAGRGIWLGLCGGLAVVALLLLARWIRLSRAPARV